MMSESECKSEEIGSVKVERHSHCMLQGDLPLLVTH